MALVFIAALVPIGLYLLIIANVGNGVASRSVRLTRPLWLMLLITPGISVGHGIGVQPMLVLMFYILGAKGDPGRQLAFNAAIWLVYVICGFLAELWVARRRARQREEAVDPVDLRDRADALKQLSNSSEK